MLYNSRVYLQFHVYLHNNYSISSELMFNVNWGQLTHLTFGNMSSLSVYLVRHNGRSLSRVAIDRGPIELVKM